MGRKKKKEEEEVSTERWLVSYADFITLLFAFFTTLYAISTVDAQKLGKMVTSMRAAFDTTIFDAGSSRMLSLSQGPGAAETNAISQGTLKEIGIARGMDKKGIQKAQESLKSIERNRILYSRSALGTLKKRIEALIGPDIQSGQVHLYMEPRGLIISLGEKGVFDSGCYKIKPEGMILLDKIAGGLVSVANHIRIEGHTDSVPICNSKFPSNWELSTARATSVISHIIGKFGFQPEMLSASGYGEYRPTASNETPEGRARNRRVDILILDPAMAQTEPR